MKKELILNLKQFDTLKYLIDLEFTYGYSVINVNMYKIVIENNELKLFRHGV